MVIDRLIQDNTALPELLKKSPIAAEVEQLALSANLVVNTLVDAVGEMPASTHENLRSSVKHKFVSGFLDSQLGDYIQTQPEAFLWDNLPVYHEFKGSLHEDMQHEVSLKEEAAAQQLLKSTLADVIVAVAGDQARYDKYAIQVNRYRDELQLKIAKFAEGVAERGRTAVQDFVSSLFYRGSHLPEDPRRR